MVINNFSKIEVVLKAISQLCHTKLTRETNCVQF
jgi:hypothetical protein